MKINGLNNAINLAFYEWLGDANLLNNETSEYLSITKDDICRVAKNIFKKQFISTNLRTIKLITVENKYFR